MLDKMRRGEPVLGCQVCSRSPLIAELIAYCGLDYVFIESEHTVHNIETVENQIRAIQLAGATPIIRIPSHEDGLILQVLEAGVMGVIFPHIDTAEQARHAVDAVKFAPLGKRGFSDGSRASKYGLISTEDYVGYCNRNVMVIGMIESREGIENLDGILRSGIDVLRVGSKDLSMDMGFGGIVTPEVRSAVEHICRTVAGSDVIMGDCGFGGLTSPEDMAKVYAFGCRMFTLGSELAVLRRSLSASVKKFGEYKNSLAAPSCPAGGNEV